ncbi:MAG: ORF6N domain-containing protein [Desulfosarcina sp.]|nr:ORF6N domain-containing protein [Desulfobacterales bacterium]
MNFECLYEVETRVLKQAVRRNIKRFPDDFMFELSKDEFKNWRSQIGVFCPSPPKSATRLINGSSCIKVRNAT